MIGVTHVQVQAALHFDDGYTITLATPIWQKDIRDGDYFSQELIETILTDAGVGLAETLNKEGLDKIHYNIKQQQQKTQTPRKNHANPTYYDDFSNN